MENMLFRHAIQLCLFHPWCLLGTTLIFIFHFFLHQVVFRESTRDRFQFVKYDIIRAACFMIDLNLLFGWLFMLLTFLVAYLRVDADKIVCEKFSCLCWNYIIGGLRFFYLIIVSNIWSYCYFLKNIIIMFFWRNTYDWNLF